MKKSAPISIRLRPDLKEALGALADADRRTLSNYVELVLQEHVDRAKRPAASRGKKTD